MAVMLSQHDLVGALLGVAQRGLDGLAAVAQVDEVDALDDAAAGDVEARDDALTQHRRPSATTVAQERRAGRARALGVELRAGHAALADEAREARRRSTGVEASTQRGAASCTA